MIDVIVSAIGVFRRQGVSRQAGAAHADGQFGAEATGHAQHLAFVGQVQAVAGLDFDAGDAITHQAFQAFGGTGEQFIFAGRAGGAHGAGDAATAGGDFRVADALQALFEFTAAVTAEHRVGVAVDQSRGDPGAFKIVDGRVIPRRQFSARADPLNERA
ncbi:N-formimino-L-glutamate deiminase [compost metagenome]